MVRRTVTVPRGTSAQEGIRRARESQTFTAAPGARRKRRGLPREPRDDLDTGEELAVKFEELFERDSRSDAPSEEAPARRQLIDVDELGRAQEELKPGQKIFVDKAGRVSVRNQRGHIVKFIATPRAKGGRFATREQALAGEAKPGASLEQVALRRIIAVGKSLFQSSGGVSPARLQAAWEGYRRAHPEARGKLQVEGDIVKVIAGKKTIATTRVSRPGEWHEEDT